MWNDPSWSRIAFLKDFEKDHLEDHTRDTDGKSRREIAIGDAWEIIRRSTIKSHTKSNERTYGRMNIRDSYTQIIRKIIQEDRSSIIFGNHTDDRPWDNTTDHKRDHVGDHTKDYGKFVDRSREKQYIRSRWKIERQITTTEYIKEFMEDTATGPKRKYCRSREREIIREVRTKNHTWDEIKKLIDREFIREVIRTTIRESTSSDHY